MLHIFTKKEQMEYLPYICHQHQLNASTILLSSLNVWWLWHHTLRPIR